MPTPSTPTPILPLGRYRHYKGRFYQVLGLARHSETEQWLVVYQPEYGDRQWWVRPLDMFTESVAIEGRQVPRFERVESPSLPST